MILHNEPLKTSSLNVVLEEDIEIFHFPPPDEALNLRRRQADAALQPSQEDSDRDTSRVRNGGELQEKPHTDVRKWQLEE
jgi:hypothetical protein